MINISRYINIHVCVYLHYIAHWNMEARHN
jgi:hypothetical protein